MTYSIYHFFADLCKKKQEFPSENKLESFPFDKQMLSCVGDGKFPDLAIKLNNDNEQFTGGELIELKESKDKYSVASFNSTIPTGEKDMMKIAFQERDYFHRNVSYFSNQSEELLSQMEVFILQHHFNGKFLIFQTNLVT